MKALSLFAVILLSTVSVFAQQSFFPSKVGTVLVYKTFDKKDKVTGSFSYTIKQVNGSGQNFDITYLCESNDAKGKPVFKEEITVHQKGDVIYLDMGNFISKAAFQQNGEIPAEVQVKGNNMEMPLNPQPGQTLPDASVDMSLKMGFVSLRVAADVTSRKVEAIEDLTVSGGNFKCYKLSSQVNSVALGFKVQSSVTEWYAKGIGIVKSESYDKKGQLVSRTELVEVK